MKQNEKEIVNSNVEVNLNMKENGISSNNPSDVKLTAQEIEESHNIKVLSPGKMVLKRFFRSKLSIVGLIGLAFVFLFSFLGPVFSPYGEVESIGATRVVQTIFSYTVTDEITGEDYVLYEVREAIVTNKTAPTWKNWLGTDSYGYDVLTRLMYGGRISLVLSFIVVFAELIIGML